MTDALPSLHDALEVVTFRGGFNTNTVILGTTMLGLAGGVVGVFALLRKRSMLTDALSHATLPGIGLAFLAAAALGVAGRSLPVLLAGGAATGLLGVACVQAMLRWTRLREDAAIGIVLSVFFGAGVVVLSVVQGSGAAGAGGLDKFIYGQTAAMRAGDAWLMAAIAGVAIALAVCFFKEFAIVCFNDSFARVDGYPVSALDLAMMGLAVLVTVAGLQAVGILLVVAMLIIPPVAARFWTDRLWRLFVIAGAIGASSGYLGAVVSALLPRKPAGAVIVLVAGAVFAVSMMLAPRRGVIASLVRRLRLRLQIAGDHLLESAYEANSPAISRETFRSVARERGWSWLTGRATLAWLRASGHAERAADTRVAIRVTATGMERGARVDRNHRLWEQYLIRFADIAPSHVDWSVDQVEHVLSEELIAELERGLRSAGANGRESLRASERPA